MLINLSISNYALINRLELQPSLKLNTITGETGAGKSIMLGAMGLLLGKRFDSKALLDVDKKCVVEGQFNIKPYKLKKFFANEELDYADETIIRREVSASGKSRAFVNDTPVTLEVLKKLSIHLIDIHSQHDTLLLGSEDTQLQIVDFYAQNEKVLLKYRTQFSKYKKVESELNKLKDSKVLHNEEFDFNKARLKELSEIGVESEEEFVKISSELNMAENAEEMKVALSQILQIGNNPESSVLTGIEDIKSIINEIAKFSPVFEKLSERIDSVSIELNDIFSEVEHEEQEIDFNEQYIAELRDKIDTINSLLHRHGVHSVEQLLEIKSELEEKISTVESFDEKLEECEIERKKEEDILSTYANELTVSREAIFEKLIVNVEHILRNLGMPNATFKIEKNTKRYSSQGVDDIQLLFSANKGVAPQTIKQVASGGEFSRVMFTIKYLLASKTSLPTIIFDEIDTGISGEIAIKMGKMMKRMAESHQVLTITHLPQVAALGDKHLFVFKEESVERTYSNMKELQKEERELEIAKMISGDNPSQVAFENARELLSLGN